MLFFPGFIDEDELFMAMQYLGYVINESIHEKIFKKIDFNDTGSIDWYEFREIFILLCDVRKELEDRNVELPTIIPKSTMQKQLRSLLVEEDMRCVYVPLFKGMSRVKYIDACMV